jgi:hypothetical protein
MRRTIYGADSAFPSEYLSVRVAATGEPCARFAAGSSRSLQS